MPNPKIKITGAARNKGVPSGYILGRSSGGKGDVELLNIASLRRMGVASTGDVGQALDAATGPTGVTPGSYTNTNLTVGADGRLTAATSGAAATSSLPLSSGDLVAPALVFGSGMVITVPITSARLDTRLIAYLARGVIASRPVTPSVTTGGSSCYFATDTGKFFVWSGAAWVQIN